MSPMRSIRSWRLAAGLLCLVAGSAAATPFDSGGTPISDMHFRVAYARQQRGRFTDALRQMSRALVQEPTYANGYLYRARLEISIGDFAAARGDIDHFATLQPNTRIAAIYRAKLALYQADGAAALAALNHAAALPYGDTEHVKVRIYSYFSDAEFFGFRSVAEALVGQNDAAFQDFKVAVRAQAKNDGPILNDICHAAGVAGLFDLGTLACQESIASQWVDSSRPYANLAYIELRQHKWAEAIANDTKALARQGGFTSALYGRGIARIATGDTDAGKADLARARAREPQIDDIMARLHAPTEATWADKAAPAAPGAAQQGSSQQGSSQQGSSQQGAAQQGLTDIPPVHVSPD